ncbi:hypothetical protein P4B35_23815 [Pontiellaceae bacterium B12227]|nr:hypothetical protein [Pontiellaceae bacterium B12227]
MKKKVITFIVLSGAHFCALVFFFLLTIGIGFHNFDNPESGTGIIDQISSAALFILGLPFVTPMLHFSIHGPTIFEWLSFPITSLFWGMVGTFIAFKIIETKKAEPAV